jgi:hypothetical protein
MLPEDPHSYVCASSKSENGNAEKRRKNLAKLRAKIVVRFYLTFPPVGPRWRWVPVDGYGYREEVVPANSREELRLNNRWLHNP